MLGYRSTDPPWRTDKENQNRRNTTQGAYDALGAVNRQPWYPQKRGPGQEQRCPKLLSKPPSGGAERAPGPCFRATEQHAGDATGRQFNENTVPGAQQGPVPDKAKIFNTSCGALGADVLLQGALPLLPGDVFGGFRAAGAKTAENIAG